LKEDTRKRLSELILEELSDKIRRDENLCLKLEPFADLPVEKVADALLKQFEHLLSNELRDLIIHLIEQEIAAEEASKKVTEYIPPTPIPEPEVILEPILLPAVDEKPIVLEELPTTASIMEHFGAKEHFPSEPMNIELKPNDWFYLYAFCYAPESTGKGIPSRQLALKGVDGINNIFLLDYGDVRFFMNKLSIEDYSADKSGKPTLTQKRMTECKYEHENILNILRGEDVVVTFPFWTIIQNREKIINLIEDKYVELLRSLIDVHDALDWDVEVFAYDQYIIELNEFAEVTRDRTPQRESRHPVNKGRNIKVMEKLIFKEKNLAQEIHSQLLLHSNKSKIDFMIRLDNAFMDDWKSILDVRYTVGKEKRKSFCQTVRSLQKEYESYRLMFRVTNPNVRFSFTAG
jgi:hypothetical protein